MWQTVCTIDTVMATKIIIIINATLASKQKKLLIKLCLIFFQQILIKLSKFFSTNFHI